MGKASSAKAKAKAKAKARASSGAKASAVQEPPKPIIDQNDASDLPVPDRKLRRRDSDQQVKKILYDHFRDLSDEEVFLREVGSQCLHDRLVKDRMLWKKGDLEMGSKYYAKLRQEYANPDGVDAKLKATNPDDELDEALAGALTSLITSKTNVQQFVDWADTVGGVNNLNLIAMYRQALKMPTSRALEHTVFSMAVLKLIKRLGLHEAFPVPWALMREHFDKCLQSSVQQFKAQGQPLTFWWRTNKSFACLILPADAVEKTMNCQGSWKDVTAEVEHIFNSSGIGRSLMEKAMRQVSLEKVSKVIDDNIRLVMEGAAPICVELLDATRDRFVNDMKSRCIDVAKPYDKAKEVDCKYRGLCTIVMCSSPMDHYNIMMASALRTSAVDDKLLDPMWCENDLVGHRPGQTRVIALPVLASCKMFREALSGLLSHEEATGPNIQDVVKSKGGWLQSIDNRCRVELAFWSSSIGDAARERVQQAILQCLPCPKAVGETTSLTTSLSGFDKLVNSTLIVFAGSASSAIFSLVHGFVRALKAGTTPAIEKAGDSAFMITVKLRLGLYLTCKNPLAGRSSASVDAQPKILVGVEAARKRFADIVDLAKQKKEIAYVDLTILLCFSWLLDPVQVNELKKFANSVVSGKGGDLNQPAAKKAKKGSLAPSDAKDMVAMLFKR
jgi:hypothetical protein